MANSLVRLQAIVCAFAITGTQMTDSGHMQCLRTRSCQQLLCGMLRFVQRLAGCMTRNSINWFPTPAVDLDRAHLPHGLAWQRLSRTELDA